MGKEIDHSDTILGKRPPESYWMASTSRTDYPSLQEDLKLDLAVIGGGITGILTAYLLRNKGLKTAIFEADHILMGTTGHTTAKITSQHDLIYHKIKTQFSEELAQQYADANESSIRMYQKIATEHNLDCDLVSQSAYVYTLEDEYVSKISDEVTAASSLGIKASYLEEIPLPFSVKAAVRFDDQAQFHPLKFLLPLAREITMNGNPIYEQTRIVDIEEDNGYTLTTGDGKKITAEKVLIASHYPFYNRQGMYFSRIYVDRSYAIAIKAKEDYPGGMYINAEKPARSFRSQPSEHGNLIIVGGDHHKTGQGEDTNNHYKTLIDFANDLYTVEDIPYRWSTQDCMTLDNLPYVGHYTSETPNMYVATGYGKWGMSNSMTSAMLLSDLIIHGKSPWQDVYNPSRKTLLGSAKNFIVENFNVADKLIEGKFSPLPEKEKTSVQKGEAKVLESDGQRVGVYRDEQGKLHVVDTTCTHMGCELNWNSAEKSWDCPCHGSRFSYDGDVIEGPAVQPLTFHHNLNPIKKLLEEDF